MLELTIGTGHGLTIDEGVVIADNSLTFTCAMDGNQSQKTYPRPSIDRAGGRSIPTVAVSDTTITVNVGASPADKLLTAVTGTTYNPSTGDLVLQVGQHGIGVGRNIVLDDGAVTFTCSQDGNATNHPYPRSTDPASGASLAVTAVGTTSHTATDAPYNALNGNIEFTIANHGFEAGDYIKIDDNALTYTCVLDGNSAQKSYPRAGYDAASNRWLQIISKTQNTFIVNVGTSPYTGTHSFVSAASGGIKRQDGTLTVNVGTSSNTTTHTFVSGTTGGVKFLPQTAHTFVSASSNAVSHTPQSTHAFVRSASESIAVYAAGANTLCSGVNNTINTLMDLLEDILDGTIQPGATTTNNGTLFNSAQIISYPDNFIYDSNNNRLAIRGDFDEFPIIEASPYTQNASVISFLGGGCALVDGSKVKQPNCPFPGLELDGSASFPNQGKSMVASAFTIVSFGGTGYKVINDGYTQLVSVFVIFCQDGVLAESGGYCSITNSCLLYTSDAADE